MSHTRTLDDKTKVIQLHANGLTYRAIAEQTPYSVSGVRRIVRVWKKRHTIARKPGSGRPPKVTPQKVQEAVELFEAHPRKSHTRGTQGP